MTDAVPEVQFVLDAIADNWTGSETDIGNVPLERIDRDNAYNLDQDRDVNKEDPPRTNIVGAASADQQNEIIGTEYDQRIDYTVNVRIQAADARKHGEVDREDVNGVQWQYLVENVRRSILTERKFPSVSDRPNHSFYSIQERNIQDFSSEYGDWLRWSADYIFNSIEELP